MSYFPKAILFDGSTDFQVRGAALTGVVNSKSGIVSFWLRIDGNGALETILRGVSSDVQIIKNATTNVIDVFLRDVVNAVVLDIRSTITFVAGGGYKHVLASWDVATGAADLYVDDVSDLDEIANNDLTIDYVDTDFGFGARTSGANPIEGAVSDFYFAPGQYLDFSVEANRREFIDANGNPVFLGTDGSLPTGTAPAMYMQGATSGQDDNSGTGGDFTTQATQEPDETQGPVGDGTDSTPPSTYVPSAILFDGVTDYLLRGSDLLSNVDSKSGILSTWIRIDAATAFSLMRTTSTPVQFIRTGAGNLRIIFLDAALATALDMRTVVAYGVSAVYIHLLASWDVLNTVEHLFVDDISDKGSVTNADLLIDYTQASWSIGGTVTGAGLFGGALADYYFAPGQFLDFSVEANRRKFIDANGNPVYLGGDGSLPTGTPPAIYLSGNNQDQGDNSGYGGDFVSQGTQVPNQTPGPIELIGQEQILSRRSDRYHRLHR